MKNIQNLTIDINKKPFQGITANVGEVASRFIRITILDSNMPIDLTGVTAYLYAKKADGTKVFNNVTIEDKVNGIVSAELTSQVLAAEGIVELTLLLVKNNAKLCTKRILLNVDKTIVDDEAIESSNEFGALTESLFKVNEWNGYFEETSGKIEEKYTERLNSVDLQIGHITKNHVYISEFDGTVQEAIDYCINNKCDLIINKDLVVEDTLRVNNNSGLGCRIVGTKNKPKITLNSNSDIPLFYFYAGSGAFSNTGLENVVLSTTNTNLNTAIKVNGVCNGKFNNISISNFKYGIHLCNDTGAGTFTELNTFNDIVLNSNINGIRMEKLAGDDSFHGNSFVNVYMNIYDNQIGFNHVSGYYYNGNFRLYMWSHSESAIYLNANGTAETNIGDITYESFKRGKFTGNGRFWFAGAIKGIGSCNTSEIVTRANGEHVIHCDNFIRNISNPSMGTITSSWNGAQHTGINAGIYGINNDNEKSFLINGYNYSNLSRLYLGTTGYGLDVDNTLPGLYLSLNGRDIKTYNNDGLTIYDADGNSCLTFKNGKVTGSVGKEITTSIKANAGVAQSIILTNNYQDSSVIFLASLKIKGSNFEDTRLYSVNHQGYGGNGSCTQLAQHYNLSKDGVSINSVTVDTVGNLVLNITTNTDLIITARYQGIGLLH